MKVNPSVKPICEKCRVIRRHGTVMVICKSNTELQEKDAEIKALEKRMAELEALVKPSAHP